MGKRVGWRVGYLRESARFDSHPPAGISIERMPDLKRVVSTVILGLVLTFALAACDSEEPPNTAPPGDSDTTSPVGS